MVSSLAYARSISQADPCSFTPTGESILQDHGVEVVNLGEPVLGLKCTSPDSVAPCITDLDSCKDLMKTFIKQSPEIWNEVRQSCPSACAELS